MSSFRAMEVLCTFQTGEENTSNRSVVTFAIPSFQHKINQKRKLINSFSTPVIYCVPPTIWEYHLLDQCLHNTRLHYYRTLWCAVSCETAARPDGLHKSFVKRNPFLWLHVAQEMMMDLFWIKLWRIGTTGWIIRITVVIWLVGLFSKLICCHFLNYCIGVLP